MKAKLCSVLAIMCLSISSTLFSQTQKISFETSEGYSVGSLGSQGGWTAGLIFGNYDLSNVQITTSKFTDGTKSLALVHDNSGMAYVELKKDISTFTNYSDVEISMDVLFEKGGGYGYINFLKLATGGLGDTMAGITFNYNGKINVYDQVNDVTNAAANPQVIDNQFHTFKILFKQSTNTLSFYLDNNLISSPNATLGPDFPKALALDFTNQGTNVYFDNIKITNITGLLATSETTTKDDVQVYPNPVVDKINLKSVKDLQSVVLYDAKGAIVRDFGMIKSSSVDVSNIATGNYLLKITTKNSEFTKKIIKK